MRHITTFTKPSVCIQYIYFNESKDEKYKNLETMHIYMTLCKEEDGVCFTFVLRSVKFSSKIDSFSFLIKCVSDNRRQRTSLDQKDCSLAWTIDIYVAYYPLYGLSFCTTKSIQYSTFWTKFVSFFHLDHSKLCISLFQAIRPT